jgi:urocanate hydratase
VDELSDDPDRAIDLALRFKESGKPRSIAYLGNIVDLWERTG